LVGRSEEINHATVVCAAHRHPDTYSCACDRDGPASMIDVFDRAISVLSYKRGLDRKSSGC